MTKVLAVLLAAAASIRAQQIELAPRVAMLDESPTVLVTGLIPRAHVIIRASLVDEDKVEWTSWAEFVADSNGVVNVSMQPPLKGSYDEVSALGLVWSMLPTEGTQVNFAKRSLEPLSISFEAVVNSRVIGKATLTQRWIAPNVRRIPIRDRGLVGTLFIPAGKGPFPGVIQFTGSAGGETA